MLAGSLPAAVATPECDAAKTIYFLRGSVAKNLRDFQLSKAELELVMSGLSDSVEGKTNDLDEKALAPQLRDLALTRREAMVEKEAAKMFAAKAAQEKGARVEDSGLIYTEIRGGSGAVPTATDKVKVYITGP